MKKLSFLMFLLAVCGLLLSCSSSSPEIEKEDLLRKEVFAIHDEVMPRMGEIVKLKGKLKQLSTDTLRESELRAAILQLEQAEDGMMKWMTNFTQPEKLRENKSHAEIMAYLEQQKIMITMVKDAMNGSITVANQLVEAPQN